MTWYTCYTHTRSRYILSFETGQKDHSNIFFGQNGWLLFVSFCLSDFFVGFLWQNCHFYGFLYYKFLNKHQRCKPFWVKKKTTASSTKKKKKMRKERKKMKKPCRPQKRRIKKLHGTIKASNRWTSISCMYYRVTFVVYPALILHIKIAHSRRVNQCKTTADHRASWVTYKKNKNIRDHVICLKPCVMCLCTQLTSCDILQLFQSCE